jgi:small-conductance mechanosensitive channel
VIASIQASQKFLSAKFDDLTNTIKQLVLDNITLKNNVQQLQNTTQQQQQQISTLSNELQEVRQELLQKDLVLTGLPNLTNINVDVVLTKASEIYNFPLSDIANTEIISGINKISKKPFSMIFMTMKTVNSKREILSKQKSIGPILWDQLTEGVPENLKANKIRFNNRLTQYKQSILNEGKKFSRENQLNVPFVWDKNGRKPMPLGLLCSIHWLILNL